MAKLNLMDLEDAPLSKGATTSQKIAIQGLEDVPKKDFDFSILQTFANVPQSAKRQLSGIYELGKDVIGSALNMEMPETFKGISKAAQGTYELAERKFSDSPLMDIRPYSENEKIAMSIAAGAKERYGGVQNIQKTIQEDPVGFLFDFSGTAGTLGGAAKLSGLSKAGDILGKTSKYTDPLYVPTKTAGYIGTPILGLSTGAGGETISQIYQSAKAGEKGAKQAMRGKVSANELLTDAQTGLQNLIQKKNKQYQTAKEGWAASKEKLNFDEIKAEFNKQNQTLVVAKPKYKLSKKGPELVEPELKTIGADEQKVIDELQNVIEKWEKRPDQHTALGLDALKQRIDAIYPSNPDMKQAQRILSGTRNKVKDMIQSKNPDYKTAMADYEEATSLIKDIKQSLSLNDKASKDAALTKILSSTRDNRINRFELVQELEKAGGKGILGKIAGYSSQSVVPRGLVGQLTGTAGLLGLELSQLPLLTLTSPRIVGEAADIAGRVARREPYARYGAIGLSEAGRLPEATGLLDYRDEPVY